MVAGKVHLRLELELLSGHRRLPPHHHIIVSNEVGHRVIDCEITKRSKRMKSSVIKINQLTIDGKRTGE